MINTDAASRALKYVQVDNYSKMRGIISQYTFLTYGKVQSYTSSTNTVSVLVKGKIVINNIEVLSLGGNSIAIQIVPKVGDIVLLLTTKEVIDTIKSFTLKDSPEYDLSSMKAIPIASADSVDTTIVCDNNGVTISSKSVPINTTVGSDSKNTKVSVTDSEASITVKGSTTTSFDMSASTITAKLDNSHQITISSSGVNINNGHLLIS
jgi:hypothetical protein